jgi:hypothetical protein
MDLILVAILLITGIGAVLWPLLRRDARAPDPTTTRLGEHVLSEDEVAREVGRYREALRAGSVCRRCAQANPPGSRFCAGCGRPLGRTSNERTAEPA